MIGGERKRGSKGEREREKDVAGGRERKNRIRETENREYGPRE